VATEEMTGRSPALAAPAGDAPAPGTTIDRFIVLGTLGSGGMGMVLLAYDPSLDRKLALKLLRPDLTVGVNAEQRAARLVREAQAMAKIAHPNVLAVHDVGTFQGQVFFAMEHVDGVTLTRWLEARRGWREIVARFVAAARGLAAAHALGLVHRDFKPDNVLVDRDGHVRVTDFGVVGVARVVDDDGPRPPALPASGLTLDGVVVGTPGYIAPEQRAGGAVDGRADQYALAVALERALGDSAPGRVARVLRRGRAAEPEARFPSMTALADALERRPAAPALAAAGVLVALAVAGVVLTGRGAAASVCSGGAARVGAVWGPAARARVRDAFLASGKPFAPGSLATVERVLDGYADSWVSHYREACSATAERHEQSDEVLDRRMACLGDRLKELDGLTELYGHADAEVVQRAVGATSLLGRLDACDDVGALTALPPLPRDPAARAQVEELRGAVLQARVLAQLGRWRPGLALVAPWLAAAPARGYLPAFAELLVVAAKLLSSTDDVTRARALLEGAAAVADRAGDDPVRARAWGEQASLVGSRGGDYAGAHRLMALADAALARAGGDPDVEAILARIDGELAMEENRFPESLERAQRAAALAARRYGPASYQVALALPGVANALEGLSRQAEAIAAHLCAIGIFVARVGPVHLNVARELNNLGTGLYLDGKVEGALAVFQQSLAIQEQLLGSDNTAAQDAVHNVGEMLDELGRFAEALPYEERSLAVWEKNYGPTHPRIASGLVGVGKVRLHLGRAGDAVPLLERALPLRDAGTPLQKAEVRLFLGQALWQSGQDRRRGRTLVTEAHTALAGIAGQEKEAAEAARWLAEH
jgi:tetratricopeptide (TPR) repeat protein